MSGAESGVDERRSGIRDEAPEFAGVFDTGCRLDAARDVERVGIERRGFGHVIRRQSARDEYAAQVERAQLVEPARPAGAAEKLRMKRVDQNKVGLDFTDIDRVERRVRAQP